MPNSEDIAGQIGSGPNSLDDYLTRLCRHDYSSLGELSRDLRMLKDEYHIERYSKDIWFYASDLLNHAKNAAFYLPWAWALPEFYNIAAVVAGYAAATYYHVKCQNPRLFRRAMASAIYGSVQKKMPLWQERGVSDQDIIIRVQGAFDKHLDTRATPL